MNRVVSNCRGFGSSERRIAPQQILAAGIEPAAALALQMSGAVLEEPQYQGRVHTRGVGVLPLEQGDGP